MSSVLDRTNVRYTASKANIVMAVKKKYSSEVRATQALETRRSVVAVAARLFIELGYGSTTMDAVAEAAGVSRMTVFNSVGGKLDLLRTAIDQAVAGDDRPVPLLERPEIERLGELTEPHEVIQEWATLTTTISGRVAALSVVLAVAAGVDDDARALRDEAGAQRHNGQQAFVTFLESIGGLRSDIDLSTAADIAWLYSDPQLYHRLVIERHWTPQQFEEWLGRAVSAELTALHSTPQTNPRPPRAERRRTVDDGRPR